ncbi:molybdopterin-dependent oxidoreductase, partial [Salmonella sp. SAL4359]|uniref:molybdopterin-dependent oxidoreductase n=1 Tax=Salmonella sp. SAL4359 TaxID=3159880 RepID=UPI00397A2A07
IKVIWIVCNNPLVSLPNLDRVKRALEKCELVIVQDCFETETTRMADFVLPATQWIERAGTMTNSERRVTRSVKLVEPPGEAQP